MAPALRLTALLVTVLGLTHCALLRFDPLHPYLRSDIIQSPEVEQRILAKAHLAWTPDQRIRVLYVSGTPYERGYQQGYLLRNEVQANVGYIYRSAIRKFRMPELFDEAYERMRPYIPQEYIDEMRGLAHGSKLPLQVVHALHALPSITEWGGKRKLKEIANQMINVELGTSCSNFCVKDSAVVGNDFYAVRILDWGLHRISNAHKYPLITVNVPEHGHASANIGWIGFLGAISGMNDQGITLGEMGYGNPEGETLAGKPMPFLLREILDKASNLSEVRSLISGSKGDCSFVYLMSDGKSRTSELYIRDKDRFLVYKPEERIVDRDNDLAPIKDTLYGGHYEDVMTKVLSDEHGKITPELLMEKIIPQMVMPSNFQNVVYDPVALRFWVANAASSTEPAAQQPYSYYDFAEGLKNYRALMNSQKLP